MNEGLLSNMDHKLVTIRGIMEKVYGSKAMPCLVEGFYKSFLEQFISSMQDSSFEMSFHRDILSPGDEGMR